jgi:membrane associated rhomboid family serine protease
VTQTDQSTVEEIDVPRMTRAVQWIIAVNVAIYFLQLTVVSPRDMQFALGFQMRNLSTDSWWTIGTYMFVHGGLVHLASNMLMLFVFGPRIEHHWGAGAFLRFYLICGLGGWFLHLLFARNSLLVGASAAILGVMLAYGSRWPDDEVFLFGVLPIRVRWLVAFAVGLNLAGGIWTVGHTTVAGTAYLAHLGGLAAAWIYLRSTAMPGIDRLRQRVSQLPDLPDDTPRAIPRSLPRSREKLSEADQAVAKSNAAATRPAKPAAAGKSTRPVDLDAVLDKISREGIESLTRDEKRLLEEASQRLKSTDES